MTTAARGEQEARPMWPVALILFVAVLLIVGFLLSDPLVESGAASPPPLRDAPRTTGDASIAEEVGPNLPARP